MSKSLRYQFKGWDWTELADYFKLHKHLQDGDDFTELQEFIYNSGDGIYHSDPKVVKLAKIREEAIEIACRKFLISLIQSSKKINCVFPLWEGLSRIEDRETFLKHFAFLVGNMWT